MSELKINPEYEKMLPKLSDQEYENEQEKTKKRKVELDKKFKEIHGTERTE